MNETQQQLAVVINGESYTRAELEALPRDAELRNLARWIKEHERPNTSGAWIGSMASKADLVDLCLSGIVTTVKGDGDFVTRGSNDLSTLSPSQNGNGNGANGHGKADAASLMLQAVQAIQEQAEGEHRLGHAGRAHCGSQAGVA